MEYDIIRPCLCRYSSTTFCVCDDFIFCSPFFSSYTFPLHDFQQAIVDYFHVHLHLILQLRLLLSHTTLSSDYSDYDLWSLTITKLLRTDTSKTIFLLFAIIKLISLKDKWMLTFINMPDSKNVFLSTVLQTSVLST